MRRRADHDAGEAGLTLIEMLVVLAIVGIAAGATMLGLGVATRGASTAAEAHRLAARIRLAADDAMIGDRRMAFAWDGETYRFTGAAADDTSLAAHTLPRGVHLVMATPSGSASLGVDGAGSPIVAKLASTSERWTVTYDGVTVAAVESPPA